MSRQKLMVAYLFLVGAPLLGLLGILRSGQRLSAPVSVGGAWNLDLSGLPNATCQQLLSNVSQPFFAISQSGSRLTFTLNNPEQTTLPGTVRQNTVTVGTDLLDGASAATRNCTHPQSIHLEAELSRQGQQRTLTGTLTLAGCPQCSSLPFRAVRKSSPVKDGQ